MNRRRSDKINRQERRLRRNASEIVCRKNVRLIIDGYNLMHVTQFKPLGTQPGELQRCREGLLAMLAEQLSSTQYKSITIVFDSENAPKHLPDNFHRKHIEVLFARNENSADDLITELIRESNRKDLVVVSSDHRIHVAAGKKATAIDSEVWFDAILDRREDSEVEAAPEKEDVDEFENPFPDGYFDDLEDK